MLDQIVLRIFREHGQLTDTDFCLPISVAECPGGWQEALEWFEKYTSLRWAGGQRPTEGPARPHRVLCICSLKTHKDEPWLYFSDDIYETLSWFEFLGLAGKKLLKPDWNGLRSWVVEVARHLKSLPADALKDLENLQLLKAVAKWLWLDKKALWWPWCFLTEPEESCDGCSFVNKTCHLETEFPKEFTVEATNELVRLLPRADDLEAVGLMVTEGDEPIEPFTIFPRLWLDEEPHVLLLNWYGCPRCFERHPSLTQVDKEKCHLYASWIPPQSAVYAVFVAFPYEPPGSFCPWHGTQFLRLKNGFWICHEVAEED